MKLSRRTLLRGAGGIAVSLPLLNAMEANGQAMEGPARFGTYLITASPVEGKWWPTGTETSWAFQPTLASLNPVKSKITVLKGVNYTCADADLGYSDGHHKVWPGMLTGTQQLRGQFYLNAGWANGPSVDQIIANRKGIDPYRSLIVAAGLTGSNDVTRSSYRAASQPVDPFNNPAAIWDAMFKDLDTTDTAAQQALEKIRARRGSVLDAVRDEYAQLRTRVGSEDKARLESHMESVRTLEQRVTAVTPPPMSACTKPARPQNFASYPNADYPTLMRLHLDMIVQALKCDLTRVFSFHTAGGVSQMQFPWLGINLKQHDEINHNNTNFNLLDPIAKWYAEQFAYFCTQLQNHPEGTRTLLDNCLVWLTYEHRNANSHAHDSVPMLLAGSAGGKIRPGRFLTYSNQPHNNLLVSFLNAMGLPDTTFGDPRFCTGPLGRLV